MTCKYCGSEIESGNLCPACGATVEETEVIVETTPEEEIVEVETETEVETVAVEDPGKTLGLVSMILGIAAIASGSICSCLLSCLGGIAPALLAVAGIVTGILAMNKSKTADLKNKQALIGIILSGASLAIILVFVIINAVVGGITGYYSYY